MGGHVAPADRGHLPSSLLSDQSPCADGAWDIRPASGRPYDANAAAVSAAARIPRAHALRPLSMAGKSCGRRVLLSRSGLAGPPPEDGKFIRIQPFLRHEERRGSWPLQQTTQTSLSPPARRATGVAPDVIVEHRFDATAMPVAGDQPDPLARDPALASPRPAHEPRAVDDEIAAVRRLHLFDHMSLGQHGRAISHAVRKGQPGIESGQDEYGEHMDGHQLEHRDPQVAGPEPRLAPGGQEYSRLSGAPAIF